MHEILDTAFLSYDPLDVSLRVPVNLRLIAKRWRRAYLAIYCSRAISSPRSRKAGKVLSPRRSFAAIPIREDDPVLSSESPYGIGRSQLADLVKSKDLKALKDGGGAVKVASLLGTDLESGITPANPEDVLSRQEAFGRNTYERPRARGFFSFIVDGFKDLTIVILLFCAALSLGFGIKQNGIKDGWYDGGSIFVAVFLVIAVSAVSNFRQSRQFEKLSEVSGNIPVDVVREGRRQKVSIFEIVVGDVVFLKIGDQIPADGLFIDGHSLQIDESSMTGESDHVEVNSMHPFLFSGTKVADGYGKMLVTSVGMSTTWGEMMSSISRDTNEQTPLQARLNNLTSSIGKLGLAVAFLVLVVLLIRFFTGNTYDENGNREFTSGVSTSNDIINGVVGIVAAAVTIVVVAIPEGLPLAVTLTLAYSMKRMMKDQAMVRKLSACETMGSATTICTDKTGTLTMNQMTVTSFHLGNESISEGRNHSSISSYVLDLIRTGVALNTTGSVYKSSSAASDYEFSGSPTEKAILCWAVTQLGMDIDEEKRSYEIVQVEAFNSSKKRSGVSLIKKADRTHHVHWKGAAEMTLAMCSSFYDSNGIEKELIGYERTKLEQIIESMAARSLRCIAFAHGHESEFQPKDGNAEERLKEDGLTLLGLIGIKDPCRPGVKTAVQACQDAGVSIKMVTGDNVFTAKAIATECGILKPGDETNDCAVIEGSEFRNLSPQARLERVEKIRVMARSSPFDKLLMVQCLKQMGHVVAVTGDGTNDAPALKEADIGLSMGIQGTEVAKESSDIVILDDNFATVTTVLRWGRCVYTNIQKFLQFQLTVNVAALVINFVAAVSSGSVPLTAVQLLWVNLIMDTLGALALATERPTEELMRKPPVGRTEPLITNAMWRNLVAQATYQVAVLLTLQFAGESILGVSQATNRTVIFNAFVLCQVFNEFNAREIERRNVFEGLHRNRLFVGIVAGTVVLQVVMVEFLKRFANTERLSWGLWGICVAIAAASWPIGWVVKCVPVPATPIFTLLRLKFLRRK
ncbi:hypothetical protein MLD38_036201 [Melastoma candidum]|uniref:Uncharacterized protein n=1 Tax=Melastoma candidum TaxID=119954 RepID=A0ACB9LIV5_9MYRT|nr:hypothetical protein MLD38_036201 [Melastoma candidum]